jgi:serine phosphatase RsbU (regulator of sigma subunit)
VVFRPAGYVSGDVFDVRRVGSRSVAFFVADAVGHGVPAALMTLLVARTLRSLDSSEALDPEAALTRLNCELCAQQTGRQRFVTAVYGVLDTQSGRLRISGAGHPPPILAGVRGVERIETDGPLLGVFDGAEFPAVELELGADDVLILFSDGFETAVPDPGAQGRRLKLPTRRYVEHLVGCRSDGSTLAEAAERLEQDLDSQAGSLHQPDDVTAVLLSPARAATPTSAALAA